MADDKHAQRALTLTNESMEHASRRNLGPLSVARSDGSWVTIQRIVPVLQAGALVFDGAGSAWTVEAPQSSLYGCHDPPEHLGSWVLWGERVIELGEKEQAERRLLTLAANGWYSILEEKGPSNGVASD